MASKEDREAAIKRAAEYVRNSPHPWLRRSSNRPVSEGPDVPMLASASPADRRDHEDCAPAETSPSLGGLGQGALPRIYVKGGRLNADWPVNYDPGEIQAFLEWAKGIAFRGWRGWL